MKKVIAIIFVFIFLVSSASALAETVSLPKYDGKIAGYTISSDGTPMEKGCSYVKTIDKKHKKYLKPAVRDQRRAKGKNLEMSFSLWTSQEVNFYPITNTFSNASEAIEAITLSTKEGYGGILGFNEEGRKNATIDCIISFPSGVQMAVGHCGNTFALIRYLDESQAKAVFANGQREADIRAEREARELEAMNQPPYEPTIQEILDNGGIIVISN